MSKSHENAALPPGGTKKEAPVLTGASSKSPGLRRYQLISCRVGNAVRTDYALGDAAGGITTVSTLEMPTIVLA